MDSPAPPDVLVSMRWSADRSKVGLPGMLASEGKKYKAGQGMHGSLSAFDMHNTLIAAGPSFRKGYRDELPSGNTDVAPTVMTILGLTPDKAIEGRVLTEALVGSAAPAEHPRTQTLEASRDLGGVIWRQYLKVTTLSGRLYIDEGNCRSDAEQSAAK
jgi:hypothetical protein